MYGSYAVLVQQEWLGRLAEAGVDQNFPLNIYMVGRRPRVTIDPESIKVTAETISGRFLFQRGNSFEAHPFRARNLLGTDTPIFESVYPHTEYMVRDDSGVVIGRGKVANLMTQLAPRSLELLDLEILYIGQSYGVEGDRYAQERLQSHSTLQFIYSEAIRRSPDQEIWLALWCFDPMLIASFDGRESTVTTTTDEEDEAHIEKVFRTRISRQQEINLTEAALIRYFRPEYNEMFKNSFPNPAHRTYSECYQLDLNAIGVEVDSEPLQCRLWSPAAEPRWQHIIIFPLHSDEQRQSMFDFSPGVGVILGVSDT